MKNFEEIIPIITSIIVGIALFLGIVTAIKKSLKIPAEYDTIDSSLELKKQQIRMDEIQERQKQLMRYQKQRIRDMQRR